MIRILTIIGTRPEAIKMAMLVKALDTVKSFEHRLCVTAQHREMLDQVLDFFEITPDFDLDVMKPGQDLTDITARVLTGLRDLYKIYRPDLILVHGDTSTCLAGALSGFYAGIKVGHVEAGLRTGNLQSPFPEEANRVLVGRLANFHFAPTERNRNNLLNEGINPDCISLTGNTVIDSLRHSSQKVTNFSSAVKDQELKTIFQSGHKILLVTGHRRENFGDGIVNICNALAEIAQTYPDLYLVYPVHLNPNVQKPVHDRLCDYKNIHLTEPLDYPDFVYAMKLSWAILTDSGGVQEEAPSLGIPVLVMRSTTERPEAVDAGTVKLVGADHKAIVNGINDLMCSSSLYKDMSKANNPYGDGNAVERIIAKIKEVFVI
ncbi:non-hydrolyzing UDP-N-acetylglucosamine 2-epimerase [Neolewinella litorea]|uniref:UDP-N-acetylglucosamine 2-epimerase (non-hydrolyzing) n=1 Tax=Neolewinella litorea TaxID=2562452 RepID=A0A4S4N639_9BACT|nr:UDP-N-acetylglucosamine 2-epimerase (non-hydrolyzing) [Neolewinella litorea]THH34569.1 UDP-N-acetylglucosamine 2-epimerase (non-hydrolyzing) [Neolewinella litorea]